MRIELVRIWASPSTLHLRVVYGADDGSWIRSQEIHCPWDSLPLSTREMLRMAIDHERDEQGQEPLF